MKYNELLLKLYDSSLKLKKQSNKDYVPSELFSSLGKLLYLENTCDLYYERIDSLNSFEMQDFKWLAHEDGKLRLKFKDDYKKAYNNGRVKKTLLGNYKNIFDYIAAVFINELDDDLLSTDFIDMFNMDIGNINIESNNISVALKLFLDRHKRLENKNVDIGNTFKCFLKELELLSYVYEAYGKDGISTYVSLDIILEGIYESLSFIDYSIDKVNEALNLYQEKLPFFRNISDIFLKLEGNNQFFSNKYTNLYLDLFGPKKLFKLDEATYSSNRTMLISAFLNKLSDKEFLNSVTLNDNHLNFDKVYDIEKDLSDRKLMDVNLYSFYDIYNYYKMLNSTLEKSKTKEKSKNLKK